MPLHLESFVSEKDKDKVFAWMLQDALQKADGVFATPDKKYICLTYKFFDKKTGAELGKIVFTLHAEETALMVKDVDIMFFGSDEANLYFEEKLLKSSDANEYYNVVTADEDRHLQIETVNRYTVAESIEGTFRAVHTSAFPFALNLFEDMDALNRWMGFGDGVKVGDTDMVVHGIDPRFVSPGGILGGETDEVYTTMVGTVVSTEEVSVQFGETQVDFVMAMLDTALGKTPVPMSRTYFDIKEITPGKVILMQADVKVDFA